MSYSLSSSLIVIIKCDLGVTEMYLSDTNVRVENAVVANVNYFWQLLLATMTMTMLCTCKVCTQGFEEGVGGPFCFYMQVLFSEYFEASGVDSVSPSDSDSDSSGAKTPVEILLD